MSIEVGAVVEGVVTGITNFGAFVDLGEGKIGLIHISEVSDVYVKDVKDFLKEIFCWLIIAVNNPSFARLYWTKRTKVSIIMDNLVFSRNRL